MPTVKSIATVAEMDPGELVSACKGLVKTVLNYHTGKIKQGARTGEDFSIQNVILQDLQDPAATVTCKFDGREEVPAAWRGKILHLVATKGTKGGLSGLKIAEDTYKGKTTKVLKVTSSAEITLGIDAEHPDPDPEGTARMKNRTESPQDEPERRPPPAATQPPKPPQTPQSATRPTQGLTDAEKAELDKKDVHEAKKLAGRVGNVWLVAYAVAWHNRGRLIKAHKGADITEETFQAMVSTISIQMFRENAHLKMPYRDFELNLDGSKNGGAK